MVCMFIPVCLLKAVPELVLSPDNIKEAAVCLIRFQFSEIIPRQSLGCHGIACF